MSDSSNQNPDMNLVPLTEGGLELELSEMEYLSVKSLLEVNGIDAVVMGASQMPNLPYEILVPVSQLDDAIRVIREARQAGPDAAESAEAEGENTPPA